MTTGIWNFVDDFGADPQGNADCADQLQTALDTVAGAGGGTLVIPPGWYSVRAHGAVMPNAGNVTILARGARIQRHVDATFHTMLGGGYNATGYTGPSNISVIGGHWDGNFYNHEPMDMFALCGGENILYADLTVENITDWHAIEFKGVRNGTARNCEFKGFQFFDPVRYMSEAIQIQEALDETHSVNIVVDGCSADGYGALVGAHGAPFPGKYHDGIRVVNNRITNILNYGVRVQNMRNVVVSNNHFQNCVGAIQVQLDSNSKSIAWWWSQTENVVISGNTLEAIGVGSATRWAAIAVYGFADRHVENVVISNNILRHWNTTNGIGLQYADEATVTGNVVKFAVGGNGTAILFQNCNGSVATGNNIRYAGAGVVGYEIATGNRQILTVQ